MGVLADPFKLFFRLILALFKIGGVRKAEISYRDPA